MEVIHSPQNQTLASQELTSLAVTDTLLKF